MDDIADTARATAYNHFPRKSHFLAEWMRHRRVPPAAEIPSFDGIRASPGTDDGRRRGQLSLYLWLRDDRVHPFDLASARRTSTSS
jgi:hypothetical protein